MKYAIEIYTNKLVSATENIDKYATYKCPNCKKRVHFVNCVNRAMHFAHNIGEGTDECDLYYPGNFENKVNHILQDKKKTITKLRKKPVCSVQLVLLPFEVDWHLLLKINMNNYQGKIKIEDGLQGTVEKNYKHNFSCEVNPTKSYKIRFNTNNKCWSLDEKGLVENKINIFENNGKLLFENQKSLYWDTYYFLVWYSMLKINIPVDILSRNLKPINKWQCAEIFLPQQKNKNVEQWINNQLSKNIENERYKTRIYPIFPPAGLFNKKFPLILGISNSFNYPIQGDLFLANCNNKIKKLTINQKSPISVDTYTYTHLIEFIKFNNEQYNFHKHKSFISTITYPSVSLRIDDIFVQVNDLKTIIYDIDKKKLQEVIIPEKMRFFIIIDKDELFERRQIITPQKSESYKEFKSRILNIINEFISEADRSINLNFINYGKIKLLKKSKTNTKEDSILPNNIIKLVKWLLSVNNKNGRNIYSIPKTFRELSIYIKYQKSMLRPELEPYFRILQSFLKSK